MASNKEKNTKDIPVSESAETATIRVRALRPGYYNHIFRKTGVVFDVIPVVDAAGKTIPAKDQLSIDKTVKDRSSGKTRVIKGWMKPLGAGAPVAARRAPVVAQTKALSEGKREDGGLSDPDLGAAGGEGELEADDEI